jgi:hypothetical protein
MSIKNPLLHDYISRHLKGSFKAITKTNMRHGGRIPPSFLLFAG